MSPGHESIPDRPGDDLLTPREVARVFGVYVATVATWARAGRLVFTRTPGGHRRYRWADVRTLFTEQDPLQEQLEEDAARLYQQGWSIRQVAEKFGYSYGIMRRILMRRTTLRTRSAPNNERWWQRPE
jgi:excisionase family DNA binding protein